MSILFICHRCGEKTEFENKKDMHCNCGYYANDSKDIGNNINMRKTWSGTTKVEFDTISIDESVERMNK
jgi:ribosomal protein L37E